MEYLIPVVYIEPLSLIEYPGFISCILYTQGCNLNCEYCFNKELIPLKINKSCYSTKNIIKFLENKKNILEGVVITGGEPTIHKNIVNFCKLLKNKGFLVKINTNGTNPNKLKQLLKYVDYISIDFKGTKYIYERLIGNANIYNNVLESLKILDESNKNFQIHTTIVPQFFNDDIINVMYFTLKNILKRDFEIINLVKNEFIIGKDTTSIKWILQKYKETKKYINK